MDAFNAPSRDELPEDSRNTEIAFEVVDVPGRMAGQIADRYAETERLRRVMRTERAIRLAQQPLD